MLNSARSGYAETRRESGGMILCSMVQLGGIIYVGFLLIVVFVLTSCLPLINLITRTLFDLTVAACTTNAAGGDKKKAGKGLAASIKAQVTKQMQAAMSGTTGGMPRMPAGAAVATRGATWGDAVSNVQITGTDANGNRHLQRAGQRHAPPQPRAHGSHDAQRAQEAPRHLAQERAPSRRAQAPSSPPRSRRSWRTYVAWASASLESAPRSAPVYWTRGRPTTGVRIFEGLVF